LYELKNSGRPEAQRCIIFLTDGIIDTGEKQKDAELTQWLKDDLTAESRSLGIRIFGIAFTENADFFLIQALAQRTEGAYYRAYSTAEIAGVLDQIQTQLETPPSAEPQAQTEPSQPSTTLSAPVNNLPIEEPKPSQAAPAPQPSSKSFLKYYLPLVLIIFILIGLLAFIVYKLFVRPPRFTDQALRMSPPAPFPPVQMEPPEWQLIDLGKPGTPSINFNTFKVTVGRDEKNDLVIPHPTISNSHATIEFKEDAFFLEDQRSTNGTRLNDRKVSAGQAVRLKSGDRIEFANYNFRFVRLDQLISGDTVMLSVTSIMPDQGKLPSSSATLLANDEKQLIRSMEHHLDQIRALGVKYREFVSRNFSEETVRSLSVLARENMQQTMADGDQHCAPLVKEQAFYVVCTLPMPIAGAADWFGERYGGFTQFVFKWIRSEAYNVTDSDVFCIITFGMDQGHWVSITIVPTHEAEDAVEIMSVDFLSETEKASLALDFDDHGRVL
jgi:pSer/pThr/pTyr-binding forkhead associated (FHA) protein